MLVVIFVVLLLVVLLCRLPSLTSSIFICTGDQFVIVRVIWRLIINLSIFTSSSLILWKNHRNIKRNFSALGTHGFFQLHQDNWSMMKIIGRIIAKVVKIILQKVLPRMGDEAWVLIEKYSLNDFC